ncbi:tetratricopeptide repeat protein [uncultured Microbacterium sp.]|uniref:Tetratrico peptide repeat group 5 domain-containing protein n=1 Tax=uncultured Microbacterium sp. TaxID=191216 RepID=A0A1Y5P8T8_9MICO|nr:tetratricopeptide repeat protein [uncultured Microbacterium sp.]SBS75115.1 conserved hypothetical protein [uncultured Microbacterium sp.]
MTPPVDWDERVAAFWEQADDADPDAAIAAMRALIADRPADDPTALYEWASVHDFLGREADAVPLYRRALDRGLAGARRSQAVIQLASSLRNVGEVDEATALLEGVPATDPLHASARAFLALALHDAGRHSDALRTALDTLAPHLPAYRRSISDYAAELG